MKNCLILIIFMCFLISGGCSPEKAELMKTGVISDEEFNTAKWGDVYPQHYESWRKTSEPKPVGKSRYRKGWDEDRIVYDRLSEYPFSALLYNGWGFGIEYNEPRGHYYAVIDQLEIDSSRISPGGVCLACKTPYHKKLTKKHGMKYLTSDLKDALKMIPEENRKSGPACIDCHRAKNMDLRTNKLHIESGLEMIGKKKLSRHEKRIMACAQCHMTYYVPRKENGKVASDVKPPWAGSRWGDISIENIIKDLLTDYSRLEWKQKVTGLKMPFIRHPEFEVFSRSSIHWKAGVSCTDCHMPYRRAGSYKISDHNVTSPLKADLRSCSQCHTESATWLKEEIFTIQDRTATLIIRAGYSAAVAAKLFERLNVYRSKGGRINEKLYKKAVNYYRNAFLRLVFISAENSTGFHNPTEAGRVLGDAIAFAGKAEALLRQILTAGGVVLPENIPLDLKKYLNGRGKKKLRFKKNQEVKDPFRIQSFFM